MRPDRVTLTVPARGEFAKTARMTVAELASRVGMSYDEVDDVRIAAEEAFIYACNRNQGGDVTFVVDLVDDGVAIVVGPVPASAAPSGDDSAEDAYAAFILESVCDEFKVEQVDGGTILRLLKRTGDDSA